MARPPAGILESLAAEGLSGAEALGALREAGFTYGNEAFYSEWGRVLAGVASADLEAGAGLGQVPTFGEMAPAPVNLSASFLQKVVLTLRDATSGQTITRLVSIATDQLLSREDAIDFATDMFAAHAEDYGVQIMGGAYAVTQYRP